MVQSIDRFCASDADCKKKEGDGGEREAFLFTWKVEEEGPLPRDTSLTHVTSG